MQGTFQLPILFDLGATFVFGVTGALAAMRRGYDIVGLFALAFVTGVGGGLLRDGLFIQQGPPSVITDSRYILVILLSVLAGRFFHHWAKRLTRGSPSWMPSASAPMRSWACKNPLPPGWVLPPPYSSVSLTLWEAGCFATCWCGMSRCC